MQLNNGEKIAMELTGQIHQYFGNKVNNTVISEVIEHPQVEFNIRFEVYTYFVVRMNYDKGSFGCALVFGEGGISLNNSQQWYDTADMEIFFKEMQEEIELRIPDKFLEAKGWK